MNTATPFLKIDMRKKKLTQKLKDYIKANRKGGREAYLENKTGFVAQSRTHKSKKQYNRKENKKINDNEIIE